MANTPPALDLNGPVSQRAVSSVLPSRPPSPSRRGLDNRPVQPITCPPSQEIAQLFQGAEAALKGVEGSKGPNKMLLELADGSAYEGYSFGADKSIAGECVFTTGELTFRLASETMKIWEENADIELLSAVK